MYMTFENTYFHKLERLKNHLGNFSGISDTEIAEIETRFNIVLPKAYKEYLRIFGKNPGALFGGYNTNYPRVMNNRGGAEYSLELLEETGKLSTTEKRNFFQNSFFFFAQWLGYNYWFFDCDEKADDPEVYIFIDNGTIEEMYMTFSEFVFSEGARDVRGTV